jgi:hypothetical protein
MGGENMTMLERINEILNNPNDNFRYLMDDLIKKKQEYDDKVKFAKEMGDQENEKYNTGACEGITVAIASLIHYLYPPEK